MAVDPNSLVDYLRQKNVSARFDARRRLWATFSLERYSGSATQNATLLAALRLGEAAPLLTLASPTPHVPGSVVECLLRSSGPVTATNEIALASQTLTAGRNSLGTLSNPGAYSIMIDDGLKHTTFLVVASQRLSDGRLDLTCVEKTGEFSAAPAPTPALPTDGALLKRFVQTMRDLQDHPPVGEDSFITKYLREALQEQSLGLMMEGMTIVVVSILGGLTITVGVAKGFELTAKLLEAFLSKAIEHLPTSGGNAFSPTERNRLKDFVRYLQIVNMIPTLVSTVSSKATVCKAINGIDLGVQSVKTFTEIGVDPKYQLGLNLLWDATLSSMKLVCEAFEKGPTGPKARP